MNISDYVRNGIDDYEQGKLESALLHACIAVDGTAAKEHPRTGVRARFVQTLNEYLWLIEPMLAIGINLDDTIFGWIRLKKAPSRFADIIYEIFRTSLAHGGPIPGGSGLQMRFSDEVRGVWLRAEHITLPDTIIFALLAVAVFARVNGRQVIGAAYYLSHADRRFVIDEWWGREADVRDYFAQAQMALPRVTMQFPREDPGTESPHDAVVSET